jgi:molybdate transport system ATP-binding protein
MTQGGINARFSGSLGDFVLDAAFDMAPRGITALVGPSGSGKTTVLRCIAGLERLSGRLTVDGVVWQDERRFLPPHRRPIGYVFQEASLLAHLSVRGNLVFGQTRTFGEAILTFDQAVDLLGLGALLARSTDRLSGGERQRVAIGRALLSAPKLLLMDEPMSGLDVDSKAEILPYLERLHETLAWPILYVSHDLGEVARLADHVLRMHAGRIEPGADDAMGAAIEQVRAMAPGRAGAAFPASLIG